MPNPVSPVYQKFKEFEFNLAANQPQYQPLPTVVAEGPDVRFISRWRFTDEERAAIASGADLIFHQLTFGNPFQPVSFIVEPREENDEPSV